jgi:hypothetical protein
MNVLPLKDSAADRTHMVNHFGASLEPAGEFRGSFSSREHRVTFDKPLLSGAATSVSISRGFHLAASDLKMHQAGVAPVKSDRSIELNGHLDTLVGRAF